MEQDNKIKEISPEDRPYEKCCRFGPAYLTDAELLAVILRTGSQGISSVTLATQILNLSKDKEGLLSIHQLSVKELMALKGVGMVKALQIKCIGELSKRIARTSAGRSLSFQSPQTIAEYYMEQLRHEEQELMICMMLDTKNHLLGDPVISKGTVNASILSPREIYLTAMSYHAVHIILIHNHPSGDPTPSREDILMTKRIGEAGELLGITLMDHIIIGDCRYISFCERDILNKY
ncbi:MAG: RadC family protein [Lachnospiraceae bacterium]|jgi:DNA repair protein RadC